MNNNTENPMALFDNAVDLTDGKVTYINNFRLGFTANEVVVDTYIILPDPKNPDNKIVSHPHRFVMPLSVASELSRVLIQGLEQTEAALGKNIEPATNENK